MHRSCGCDCGGRTLAYAWIAATVGATADGEVQLRPCPDPGVVEPWRPAVLQPQPPRGGLDELPEDRPVDQSVELVPDDESGQVVLRRLADKASPAIREPAGGKRVEVAVGLAVLSSAGRDHVRA